MWRSCMKCEIWSAAVLLLVIFSSVPVSRGAIKEDTLLNLKTRLLENPLDLWLYKDLYVSLDEMFINYQGVNNSVQYPAKTPSRVKKLVYRALSGADINLDVLGGSISAGATLYKQHNEMKVFFYALQHFWNNVITPMTGSKLTVRNLALGAIGSDFYSYCLRNYVLGNETDIIIWELSANDYHRFDNRDVPPTLPLELLTRNIYGLESKPALIYAHFFRGKDFMKENDCQNLESDGANYLARYYQIPSVSWRSLVCRLLLNQPDKYFEKVFSQDRSHPSLLGHAQMGFLFIHLFRKLFLQVIDSLLGEQVNTLSMTLELQPVFIEPLGKTVYTKSQMVTEDPICFTFNVPCNGQLPYNHKDIVRVVRNDGYTIATAHGFLVRKDKTEGLRAKSPNVEIHFEIKVPCRGSPCVTNWMILIGSYSNFGGAVFFLDGKFSRVIQTEKYAYGSIVAAVATKVQPGIHRLVVKSLQKGFFISSVMLG